MTRDISNLVALLLLLVSGIVSQIKFDIKPLDVKTIGRGECSVPGQERIQNINKVSNDDVNFTRRVVPQRVTVGKKSNVLLTVNYISRNYSSVSICEDVNELGNETTFLVDQLLAFEGPEKTIFPLQFSYAVECQRIGDFTIRGKVSLVNKDADHYILKDYYTKSTIACVAPEPEISIDFIWVPLQPNVGDEVRFTNLSKANPEIMNSLFWTWDFGDGSEPSHFFNTTHKYEKAGTYYICLTGENLQVASVGILQRLAVASCPEKNKKPITVIEPMPDLIVSGVTASPSNPDPCGGQVVFNVLIMNVGSRGIDKSFTVKLFVDDKLIDTQMFSSLAAGGALPVTFSTWKATFGLHKITAIVDAENAVQEANESNIEHSIVNGYML
ncbi:PKD domain-containing protein [Candidatus Acetothermia bacterium]|nr:PKD domain-containing protein [Candidatus Acetothermia bacterium]